MVLYNTNYYETFIIKAIVIMMVNDKYYYYYNDNYCGCIQHRGYFNYDNNQHSDKC